MTTEQIAAHLRSIGKGDVADRLPEVAANYDGIVADQMMSWKRDGKVSDLDYEAYCYLWRNEVTRYSGVFIEYQIG